MSDAPHAHTAPRARPVAGLPVDAMVGRAEELARRWAIALVLARPLDGLGDIPLEELAREAPALCAQTVRALESDAELDRLTGNMAGDREGSVPAWRVAAMAGARDAAALVQDVEALRGALWEALLEELAHTLPEQARVRRIADVSDRLAYVCASVLGAALATMGAIDELAPVVGHDAEVVAELVLAGVEKFSVQRKTAGETASPPRIEIVAGRSGNGGRGIQAARPMEIGRTSQNVPSPGFGQGKIDDGIEH